jgi:hypothetical protein
MNMRLEDVLAGITALGVHAIWDSSGYVHLAVTPRVAAAASAHGRTVLVLSSEGMDERFSNLPNVSVQPISDAGADAVARLMHEPAENRILIMETLNAAGPPAVLEGATAAIGSVVLVATADSVHKRWVPVPGLHQVPEELGSRADTIVTLAAIDAPRAPIGDRVRRQPFAISCWDRNRTYRGTTTMWFGSDLTITSTAEEPE